MKVTDHFDIKELVHPAFISEHGEAKMIRVMRNYAQPMLVGIERLREFVDESIIVNDYKFGGAFINSGVRHPSVPYGSRLSAHYFMLATDNKIKGRSIKDIQEMILMNAHSHPNIVRMEDHRDTPTWLHVQWGCRNPNDQIEVFRP